MVAQPPVDISIIIVSWNVQALLRECLASLRASRGIGWDDGSRPCAEVIVVDNASADSSASMVKAEFPWVRLLANNDNRGFTRANNQGLALSRGRYAFFLNPDTRLDPDALAILLGYMEGHPAAGLAGPQLNYGDGSPQSSRRRFPTFPMALFESTPLAWHWPPERNRWARSYHLDDHPPAREAEPVDWLVGAALFVRREALDQVGGFDEGYFMYSEELDWCRRATSAGWQIVYVPAARVTHYEGKSSEQAVAARHIRFQSSKVRYFRKYHGQTSATLLRLSLLGMFAAEGLLESVKWVAGSKRPLRAGRIAAYAELLRSGLKAETSTGPGGR
jgi:N-acetylglucosaminyl-diphospho-decaprenol L-rhamnosyltransferase